MKVSAACSCLLLTIAILSTQLFAQPVSVSIPVTCCFDMVLNRIPRQNLRKYTTVNNTYCPKEAVIFKTWLGKEVCANPKEKWVQIAMKHLDQKSKRSRV